MDVREEPSERSRRGGGVGVERERGRGGVVSIPVACGAKPHRLQLHHYHPLKLSPLIILLSLHTNWSSAQVIGQSRPTTHFNTPQANTLCISCFGFGLLLRDSSELKLSSVGTNYNLMSKGQKKEKKKRK